MVLVLKTQNIYPKRNNDLVIKTAYKPKGPNLPSKRPFGTAYELAKLGLKSLGWYDQVRQYDPGFYLDKFTKKYSYKPRKRLTGYTLSTRGFLKKTPPSYNKLGKTRCGQNWFSNDNQFKTNNC